MRHSQAKPILRKGIRDKDNDLTKTLCPNPGKQLCLRRKKEILIWNRLSAHKPRPPTEILDIGLVDRA